MDEAGRRRADERRLPHLTGQRLDTSLELTPDVTRRPATPRRRWSRGWASAPVGYRRHQDHPSRLRAQGRCTGAVMGVRLSGAPSSISVGSSTATSPRRWKTRLDGLAAKQAPQRWLNGTCFGTAITVCDSVASRWPQKLVGINLEGIDARVNSIQARPGTTDTPYMFG